MSETTIPVLPCRRLGDVVPFYEALGFTVTFRQERPNPYLCLNRGGIDLHFFGLEEFDPETSLGSVIVQSDDTAELYEAFVSGLRSAHGRVPIAGIPRITRPRRKQGMTGGFTIVDPGGNWIRISASRDADGSEDDGAEGLERVLLNAARQGDSHGDEGRAIGVLDAGLLRHSDASPAERVPALLYLAELLIRSGDTERAAAVLADFRALNLDDAARSSLEAEFAAAAELESRL